MNNNKKYYDIHKKYLAESLSYLGLHYFKFQDEDKNTIYSFEYNPEFIFALDGLQKLKNQLRNKKI